jgi:hypothetical protein
MTTQSMLLNSICDQMTLFKKCSTTKESEDEVGINEKGPPKARRSYIFNNTCTNCDLSVYSKLNLVHNENILIRLVNLVGSY